VCECGKGEVGVEYKWLFFACLPLILLMELVLIALLVMRRNTRKEMLKAKAHQLTADIDGSLARAPSVTDMDRYVLGCICLFNILIMNIIMIVIVILDV
jgi:uncharacterized protein YpmS